MPEMTRLPWHEFEKRSKSFFEADLGEALHEQMPVPLTTGEVHKFDLASRDETVVIECKSYTWTRPGGNYPSGKVSETQRCIGLLQKCAAARKIIVFQDDVARRGSLVEVFTRRNRQLLTGIEVWRLLDGRFEKFADYSGKKDISPGSLQIVFDGRTKPFFEEQDIRVLPGGMVRDIRYRVGVRNTGRDTIHHARLVLEDCNPCADQGIHLGHTFQVMGKAQGSDEFSVHPGHSPSVFLDVVFDQTVGGQFQGNAFGLCYAASVPTFAILRGTYVLTLRVEGDSAQSSKQFKISQDPATGMLMMSEMLTFRSAWYNQATVR